ncbi:MAG: Patatin, partial [Daejeonella sp.]|nr:Patatin [Daejeonella sp.]
MDTNQIPSNPLEKIALSLSGGGYRAATFHLGSMSYLNRLVYDGKPLLENVKLLSTVSGGTITGIVYALLKQENKSFEFIYSFLLDKLLKLDLVATGIEMLNPDVKWENQYKNKNLINAFAEQYEEFTGGAVFSAFDSMNSHLETVLFNSTEFTNALNFRFKNPAAGYSGNYRIRIKKENAQEIKLSDVMASSSCFTAGFEPIIWPTDYVHKDAPSLIKLSETYKDEGKAVVGIMDGGIYDNQGIDSILNYKKGNDEPYFDLIIISDVASPYMDAYQPLAEKEKSGLRKLTLKEVEQKVTNFDKWINYGFIILIILSLVIAIITKSGTVSGIFCGFGIALTIFFIVKLYLTDKIKAAKNNVLQSIKDKIPEFYRTKLAKLKIEELSVHRIEPLVLDRLNSLLTLVMDVFLKVVRRLNYYKLYDDERYTFRRISNLINELTEKDFTERQKHIKT